MQESQFNLSPPPSPSPGPPVDDLARVFNTALVATRAGGARDFSTELFALLQSPAFHSILSAVRLFAKTQGLPETDAATQIIETFRKVDRIWSEYVFQEGVDRLQSQNGQSNFAGQNPSEFR